MNRDPLTERAPRELRELNDDPRAWLEGPEEPEYLDRPTAVDAWLMLAGLLLSIAIVVGAGLLLWHRFSS